MKLGEVIKHRKGFITIDDNKDYKLCRVQVNRKGVVQRAIVKGSEIKTKKQQVCKTGDFLVAEMDAKFGGYGFVPEELDGAIVSSHYFLFELDKKKIRQKYLEVISKLMILQDQIKATGSTNYAAIRPAQVLSWDIPYRDIENQKEIEILFDTITDKGSALKTELTHQEDLLKQLRKSFLKDALQGKLVKQEIKEGNVIDLLNKAKAEREKLIKQKKLKKISESIPILEDEIPFDIASNWCWVRLQDLLFFSNDSMRRGPFGSSITKLMFVPKSEKSTKVYEQKNAIYKNFELGDYFIDLEQHPNLKSFLACPGDIIISCAGTIGETYVLPDDAPKGIINQALLKIKLNNSIILNDYFLIVFQTLIKDRVNDDAKGSAMKNLGSIKYLKEKLIIPLPPLSEQKRIVKKLEEVMNLCDELKTTITNNQTYTDQLLQVSLKDALQPQNKNNAIILPALPELEEQHFSKRKVLATYIINQSLTDNKFGDVKFEKLLHLSDYVAIKRNFGQKYYQQTAGPYDNAFTLSYFQQVLRAKWFNRTKKGRQFLFSAGSNHNKSQGNYDYFTNDEFERVDKLISYFKNSDYEQPEIISTLYAVWNNRIIKGEPVSDELIKKDFLDWDVQKIKYKDRLDSALVWMKKEGFIPDGWGKAIEKAKGKKRKK